MQGVSQTRPPGGCAAPGAKAILAPPLQAFDDCASSVQHHRHLWDGDIHEKSDCDYDSVRLPAGGLPGREGSGRTRRIGWASRTGRAGGRGRTGRPCRARGTCWARRTGRRHRTCWASRAGRPRRARRTERRHRPCRASRSGRASRAGWASRAGRRSRAKGRYRHVRRQPAHGHRRRRCQLRCRRGHGQRALRRCVGRCPSDHRHRRFVQQRERQNRLHGAVGPEKTPRRLSGRRGPSCLTPVAAQSRPSGSAASRMRSCGRAEPPQ